MNRYPAGLLEYVKANYMRQDRTELTRNVNEIYGTKLTEKAMSSLKKRYHLSGGPRKKVYSDVFSENVCRYIEDNYIGVGHKAMAEMLLKEFGTEYTAQQIKSYYANHNLNSGLTGRFEKGQQPHNKGAKVSPEVYEKMKPTMFKPGNRPHNAVNVGDRTLTEDGYWKVKVAEPNEWEFEHRRIWRQNFGEIPEGMLVSFKDGDKNNLDPDNLMLITLSENALLNGNNLRFDRQEATEAGLQVARLINTVKEKRKNHGKER